MFNTTTAESKHFDVNNKFCILQLWNLHWIKMSTFHFFPQKLWQHSPKYNHVWNTQKCIHKEVLWALGAYSLFELAPYYYEMKKFNWICIFSLELYTILANQSF